jgi:broad specificity phosphatase PhoE
MTTGPPSPVQEEPVTHTKDGAKTLSIFFVRHGESEANVQNQVDGQGDSPLTEHGAQQAHEAGQLAAQNGQHFDAIISSTQLRASETAKIIAGHLGFPYDDIVYKEELRERGCGDFERGSSDKYYETPEEIAIKEHGVEPLEKLYERTKKVIDWVKETYPGKSVLLVSHNGTGKMLRIVAEGRDADELDKTIVIPNSAITRLL